MAPERRRQVPTTEERVRTFLRAGGCCALCGQYVRPDAITIDHIVPFTAGGELTPQNMQLAHQSCNARKGNRPGRPLKEHEARERLELRVPVALRKAIRHAAAETNQSLSGWMIEAAQRRLDSGS